MTRLHSRLLGLVATLGLAVFVAGVPAVLLAIDAAPSLSDFTWSRLAGRDDGTLALALIGAVAWIAWVIFTVSVVVSVAARIRGLPAPRIPGLALPQLAAGRLVGIAALLFVSVPTVVAVTVAAPSPRASAAPVQPAVDSPPAARSSSTPTKPEASTANADKPEQRTEPYTVKRGDSLWKIAEQRLGDGARYVDIVQLNRGVLGDPPDFLLPGTVLRIPSDQAHEVADRTYVVEPGDTLSEIAQADLGDAQDYPEIFDASRAVTQPDGKHLTDPDLIRPGWHLIIPGADGDMPRHPKHLGHTQPVHPERTPPPVLPDPRNPTPPPEGSAEPTTVDAAHGEEGLPGWVLPGLAGAGAALAGSLLLVLRQHRRTQLRYRRPGQIMAPPPAELRPAEKSVHASGSITAPRIEELDRALRHLGDPSTPGPRLVTATLSATTVSLHLAEPATLADPWTGAGTDWVIRLADVPPEQPGCVAPYPLLVSVGMDGDGALAFVNLEELRVGVLTGDPERSAALGRHIAAELCLNPWSALVEIDTLGIGQELVDIDPLRIHHHAAEDTAFLDRLARDLEAEDPALEPDQYRALIATSSSASAPDSLRRTAKIITNYPGRVGAAMLIIDGEPTAGDIVLDLTSEGRLHIPTFDLDLSAAGLTGAEAQACAALVDITRDATQRPVPPQEGPACTTDAAGALAAEFTEPRPGDAPAGAASLLPLDVQQYASTGATTAADLADLAPLASSTAASAVADQDPALDEDLALWQARTLAAPKLTLLGPVSARTLGEAQKIARRRPYYLELLAFLVLHPAGVTAHQIGEALGISEERARVDVGIVRHWLGEDPRTGTLHLPDARQSHTAGVPATYAVHGLLTDLDLFRRLRARGQSRGAEGIADLRAALTLVSGEPFSELRPSGWGWLLDGDRIDHIMACAIVDTAHIVTTHALSVGDVELAKFSAETGYLAAPYDETIRLDVIAVDKAVGDEGAAMEMLVSGVLNRSDDDLGPIESPERTAAILRQRGWTSSAELRRRRA